ncbi:serine O-acetyltransferase [Sphaerotilus hippei]|uniref:Serine O-acetyltransferase n=1 Tax=Sphaerotilus hippei TaxID=744406 RepID=A0A318HAF0_9BURK|nr:serine acetyltransferase [Sphaerotilus hippei]PXW95555.1 serine O-acetyltransferase [Sphaerotilus hippei]
MLSVLRADLRAKQVLYGGDGPPVSLPRALMADGTLAVLLFRCQSALSGLGLAPLALLPHLLNKWFNGCVIGVHARFGPGFVLIHPIGVVINSSVRGGCNVWLESSVVIGDNRGRSPVLGDDIFIGSGAKVIGGLMVGDGARIGANAVVLKDVPAGALAVGVPAACRPGVNEDR